MEFFQIIHYWIASLDGPTFVKRILKAKIPKKDKLPTRFKKMRAASTNLQIGPDRVQQQVGLTRGVISKPGSNDALLAQIIARYNTLGVIG